MSSTDGANERNRGSDDGGDRRATADRREPTFGHPYDGSLIRGAAGAWRGARRLARIPGNALSRLRAGEREAGAEPQADAGRLLRWHRRLLAQALRQPLLPGNHVELLIDGPQTYEAMFEAIDGARDHINLESYIVEAEGPGEEMARRLTAKCREGVTVNLLFDGFGSFATASAYFDRLREAGVRICEYNPMASWRVFSRAVHLRDHRKLLVVDGRVAFVGGINISGVYSAGSASAPPPDARTPWRDTHVRVAGPMVAELQKLFIAHWNRHAGEPIRPANYLPELPAQGPHLGAVASREAGRRRNPFYRALLKAIRTAHERVLVTTAYFVPTRRLLRSLVAAARRGVDVRIVLPSHSDAWAPLHAGRSHYGRLLQAGVRIFERQGALLHAKTTVIDGVWATVGSANLDWRSMIHNAEANVVVVDAGFGSELEAVFREDVAASREVTLAQWSSRGWMQRLREGLARRFEFLL